MIKLPKIKKIPPPTRAEIARQLKKVVLAERHLNHRDRDFLECLTMDYIMTWILRGGTCGPETSCSVLNGLKLAKKASKRKRSLRT